METIRRVLRALEIAARQIRHLLTIPRDHIAQLAAALKPHLAFLENGQLETAQDSGRRDEFIQLLDAQRKNLKGARRLDWSKSARHAHLEFELLIVFRAPIDQIAGLFEEWQRQFRLILLHRHT